MVELEFHFCMRRALPSMLSLHRATALSDREEESSNLPACRISEMASSRVLKLGQHFVVGSSRLDNHVQ